jgi:prefoldin subunit 5
MNRSLKNNISQLNSDIISYRSEIGRLHSENTQLSQQASRTICQNCTMRC